MSKLLAAPTLLAIWAVPSILGASEAGVSYSRDVRPILSARCFKCHGPDEENMQSGLRLDERASALGKAESGEVAIVPGKPDHSELVRRVASQEDWERMPPPEANYKLSPGEIDILKRWIAAGAKYEPHWAFLAPEHPNPPAVERADWPRNEIDRFVLARLEAEGLAPSPEADRHALIRRVSLDLVGIPPTPAEADAFANDPSPDAYEKLVDRLLASPHYGERWARRWLDLARYADTNGYEKDRPRSIWPYRDWVIQALNDDMPFDQFTIEQLAGDMLPGASQSQRIATGFHRNTMLNEEGGIDPLEFRHLAVVDRTNTTATVWLGLTLGCAQCHTHKFDPLTHAEYYQMMAFFNNADEPKLALESAEIADQRRRLDEQIAALQAKLPERFPLPEHDEHADQSEAARRRRHAERAFEAWLDKMRPSLADWHVVEPTALSSNLPRLQLLDDGSVLASGDQTKNDIYELELPAQPVAGMGPITAIRLEVLPHESLPGGGPGRVYYEGGDGDFFLSEVSVAQGETPLTLTDASHSFSANGKKYSAPRTLDGDFHTGWSIGGGQGRAHHAVYRLAKPIEPGAPLHLKLVFQLYYSAPLGRFRIWTTDATDPQQLKALRLPTELQALGRKPPERLTADERDRLWQHFLATARELAEPRKEIDELRKKRPAFPTTLVMAERPADHPRATHIHHRGEYLQPKESVEPGVPAVLPPIPAGAPRNRLTLARWLVDPANPLVGRVTMNRQWAALFGRGLVPTTEDFGHQGELPTHPELLDWLATEFVRQGWSMKAMHRLIVTSATYRQSSRVDEQLLARDPENRWLARGPRVRLEAELVRDRLLAASGLLTKKIGGPSVFPPQPASITSEGTYSGFQWQPSTGDDRYRRSLYTYTKRSAPFAMLHAFDAPSGEACIARRDVSNSPLQALTLLNDEMFVEAAQALGRQMAETSGELPARLETLFRRCLVRPPQPQETEKLLAFFRTQLARYAQPAERSSAEAVVGKPLENQAEAAAWVVTARALMNLDEMVTKE